MTEASIQIFVLYHREEEHTLYMCCVCIHQKVTRVQKYARYNYAPLPLHYDHLDVLHVYVLHIKLLLTRSKRQILLDIDIDLFMHS